MSLSNVLSSVSFLCWEIWKAKCYASFNNVLPSPFKTMKLATDAIREFLKATSIFAMLQVSPPHQPQWISPLLNFVKVNCDASWSKASFSMSLRVVARNETRALISGSGIIGIATSSLEAKVKGALLAMDLAVQNHVSTVFFFESNSAERV